MSDPFVRPEEPTAADAIAAIGDELDVFDDWMDRYQYIIELGRKLPPFPDAWANDAHRVPGCQSRVWMEGALIDGRLFLAGVSDAAIVSGLIALLLRVYSGRAPAEIVATDPVFLKELGLLEALSTNRGNGIAAMAERSANWLRCNARRDARGMSDGIRVALFFAALFSASAINTAFLPLWFADRGVSATAIGQILGLASLLRVIAGPSWGSLADRIGQRRPVMLTAGITACAAALLYLPLHGFLPLLVVAAMQGVAGSALNPLIDSLALALARARRMEYGPVRSFGSIAYMAASAGAGWLLSATGTFLVPWLLAVSYGAASVVTPFLPEVASRPVSRGFAGLRLLANRPFRLTVIASALIQGSHAAYTASRRCTGVRRVCPMR